MKLQNVTRCCGRAPPAEVVCTKDVNPPATAYFTFSSTVRSGLFKQQPCESTLSAGRTPAAVCLQDLRVKGWTAPQKHKIQILYRRYSLQAYLLQALADHVTGTTKSHFEPITNYDVIKHPDVTDVLSRVGDTCRYVRQSGGTCVYIRGSGA